MRFPLQDGLGSFRLAKLHLDSFPSKISGEALVWSRGRSFPVPYATGAFLVPHGLALPGCPLGLQQHLRLLQLQAAWHLHKGEDPVIPGLTLVQTPLADLCVTLRSSALYLPFPMSDAAKSVFVHAHKSVSPPAASLVHAESWWQRCFIYHLWLLLPIETLKFPPSPQRSS